jgi:hypothetical protein
MTKETESIPISEIFLDDGFERNYKLLMREENNNEMIDVITGELRSIANQAIVSKKEHKKTSGKDGRSSAIERRKERESRNDQIKEARNALINNGTGKRDVAAILAKRFDLTPRQIGNILKN